MSQWLEEFMNWRSHEVRKTCQFSNEPYLALGSIFSAKAESALPKFILVSWLCYSILGVNAPLASPLPRPTCFLKRRLFMGKGCSSGPQDRILYGMWRYGCLISPFTPGGNWVFRALASTFHFFFKNYFILSIYYLFLTVLGLHCGPGFCLVAASEGYSLVAVLGLLIAVASLVAEHRL